MAKPNPYEAPEAWGALRLNGWEVPAILIDIDGCKRPFEWAVQRGIGTSGSVLIYRGSLLAENIALTFQAPTRATFDALYEFRDRIVPKSERERPPTLNADNPTFAFVKITRIVLGELESPRPASGLNWQMRLTVKEYRPPVVAKVGPADPAKLPGDPVPENARQAEIKAKTAEFLAELNR